MECRPAIRVWPKPRSGGPEWTRQWATRLPMPRTGSHARDGVNSHVAPNPCSRFSFLDTSGRNVDIDGTVGRAVVFTVCGGVPLPPAVFVSRASNFSMYLLYLDVSGSVQNPNERYFILAGISVFERQIYH